MRFLASLFGSREPRHPAKPKPEARAAAANSSVGPSTHAPEAPHPSQPHARSEGALHERRELLRVALRDTLRRHGIPGEWITAEMASMTSRSGERGIYWRLSLRHWDARLPVYFVALQKALINRLHSFDPVCEQWLVGISWQFMLADESACPPLPHPGMWTAMPREGVQPPPREPAAPAVDVIAGPVSLAQHSGDVKADLERLMSVLDAQYQNDADSTGYAKTEPAKL